MITDFTKLNERFALIEFPVTLATMDEIKMEFPKSERAFYEITLKELKKHFKPTDQLFSFEGVQPTMTKYGFMILMEDEIVLSLHSAGLFPKANLERIPMKKVTEVDFDIAPTPFGNPANFGLGVIHISYGKTFGTKKFTIRNIDTQNLDNILARIRALVKQAQENIN